DVIIDLRQWRRDQNTRALALRLEARHAIAELVHQIVEQSRVALVDLVDVAQVEPEAALLDRGEHVLAGHAVEIALAPVPAVAVLRAHAEDAVVLARVALDQLRERVAGEQRRLVQAVADAYRLVAPHDGVFLVELRDDGACTHDTGRWLGLGTWIRKSRCCNSRARRAAPFPDTRSPHNVAE